MTVRTIVDFHAIQTVPPSNLNRDDTGSPKTAVYGGARRARVSSQAWKRAIRTSFKSFLDRDQLGVRTRRVVELLADEITAKDASLADQATTLAEQALTAAGIKLKEPRKKDNLKENLQESQFLLFLSHRQVANLADLAITAAHVAGEGTPAIDKAQARARADQKHSIDVALFGRMVADLTDLNVEAAAQVAHALSVHAVTTEYDYFTAVDDHKQADADEDAGAGMIGTVEFNSSTLYRYATVDVDRLQDNLGNATAATQAVTAFTRAFVTSMPTGKQNTFANRTLPDAVMVVVRETQPINLVGAFERPIDEGEKGGYVTSSMFRLADHTKDVHTTYDETPVACWVFGVGERIEPLTELGTRVSFGTAVDELAALVGTRLGSA